MIDRQANPKSYIRLMALVALLGAVSAVVTFVFIALVHQFTRLIWEQTQLTLGLEARLFTLLICTLGGLLVGLLVKLFGDHNAIFAELMQEFGRSGRFDYRHAPGIVVTAFISLIFGGSLGPEAPLAVACGGLGTWILVICLMFIGSAPASMGGGITTGTFSALVIAMWSFSRGYDTVRVGQQAISIAMVWRAVTVLIISLGAVIIATWLLLISQNLAFSPVLFEVVAAFSTTGLSLGATGHLNNFGRLVIIVMMFWGRVGAITIMLVLLKRSTKESLTKYPEEPVLVG